MMSVIQSEELTMGEVIRFVPKSERERIRLIRQARAIYDSVFPPVGAVSEQSDEARKAIRSAALMSIVARGFSHDQNHCCALQSAVSGKLEQTVTTSDFADVSMRS